MCKIPLCIKLHLPWDHELIQESTWLHSEKTKQKLTNEHRTDGPKRQTCPKTDHKHRTISMDGDSLDPGPDVNLT